MKKVAIITPECFKDNDKGLPNWTIFSALMTLISLSLPKMPRQRNITEDSFRHFFKSCCAIIDCTEVFIEQPSDLRACIQTIYVVGEVHYYA